MNEEVVVGKYHVVPYLHDHHDDGQLQSRHVVMNSIWSDGDPPGSESLGDNISGSESLILLFFRH